MTLREPADHRRAQASDGLVELLGLSVRGGPGVFVTIWFRLRRTASRTSTVSPAMPTVSRNERIARS